MSSQPFNSLATEADPMSSTGQADDCHGLASRCLHEVAQCLRPSFGRRESWQRAVAYIEGLLSTTERKNAWQLAEINGSAKKCGAIAELHR